jgi:hypothetical protein
LKQVSKAQFVAKRPLPSGVRSVKFVAGTLNQIVVSGAKFFSAANKGRDTAKKTAIHYSSKNNFESRNFFCLRP